MIRVLAREQWRFQRTYVVLAAAIVAAAVGFATFATLTAATQGALDAFSNRMDLSVAPYRAVVLLDDPGFYSPESAADWGVPVTSAELGDMIDRANADGAGAVASVAVWADLAPAAHPEDATAPLWGWPSIRAGWGDVDWASILAEGTAPGPRDIVLPAATARTLGVGIGDAVQVGHTATPDPDTWEFVPDTTLTVSGLAYDSTEDGWTGQAYTSPDQLTALAAAYAGDRRPDEGTIIQAVVGWQQPTPELDRLAGAWDSQGGRTFGSTGPTPWLLAALFTVGAIVTAFTLGRAQAQSRVQWIATARALGARRGHLLGVAALEWGIVGGLGAVVGVGAGTAAAATAHAHRMSGLPAAPPVGLSAPLFVIALMIALAALLSASVVAVPSVLALRVPPTAALKDTTTADTAELSRRVRFWPVAAVFLASWLGAVALSQSRWESATLALALCGIAAAVSGLAVLVESCRALVRATAARLGRSHRPWAIHASMTMTGHPQQAAALAIVQALLMLGLGGAMVSSEPSGAVFGWTAYSPISYMVSSQGAAAYVSQNITTPLTLRTVVALVAAMQVLVVAIALSSRRVARTESSTAGALGLSGSAATRGDAASWWLAQAHGTWVGALAGVVGIGAIWFANWYASNQAGQGATTRALLQELARRGLAVALIGLASLAIAAIVAAAAALVLRPRHEARPAPSGT